MIFVNKGIEADTKALTVEIILDECGPEIAKVATFIVRSQLRFFYKRQVLLFVLV